MYNTHQSTAHAYAVVTGEELQAWVATARETECLMMMDEFYSHYIYPEDENEWGKTVSSAEYVEDVNTDPIIIVDGLTKNWRCPGWRSMPETIRNASRFTRLR